MAKTRKKTRIAVNLRDDEPAAPSRIAQQHDVSLSRLTRRAVAEFPDRRGKGARRLLLPFPASSGEDGF